MQSRHLIQSPHLKARLKLEISNKKMHSLCNDKIRSWPDEVQMKKAISIHKLGETPKDYSYWLGKSPEDRLKMLEIIRKEYNSWKYSHAEQRFQRVYRIIKRK